MKKRNRETSIFSMSALDLFASALGAFILITLILMPYYLKVDRDLLKKVRQLQAQLNQTQNELASTRERLKASEQARKAAEKARNAAKKRLASARKRLKASQRAAAKARAQLENRIRFALLGLPTRSQTFVIVVDMSGSMEDYADLMTDTLARLLKPMTKENKIQIIGFKGKKQNPYIRAWPGKARLITTDKQGKRRALAHGRQLSKEFDGKTPTLAALEAALSSPADAIILLSDGAPTDAEPDQIIQRITARNGGKKEIHCVAIGEYNRKPELVRFLSQLAERNQGGFTGVSL